LCAPFVVESEAAASAWLSAQRIYQDLIRENDFGVGYSSVKLLVRRLKARALVNDDLFPTVTTI
jgi:hypothetical protein